MATSEDTQILLKAISASENKRLGEIRSVKDDITIIKSEISTVTADFVKTKFDINEIKKEQLKTNEKINKASSNINTLHE